MSDSLGISSLANIPKNDVGSFGSRRRISSLGLKYPFLAFIQAIKDDECLMSASCSDADAGDGGDSDVMVVADTVATVRLSKVRAAR